MTISEYMYYEWVPSDFGGGVQLPAACEGAGQKTASASMPQMTGRCLPPAEAVWLPWSVKFRPTL